ncbi:MAG TPA: L,D-transpeptidase [Thermoanaerobaculia bacterium]|jgi:lipoprotein-anchoring transpeptidase ErfK/SrfK|nr:L,D-transpeptidase [Thermoanaerobaculia bacterium]
MTVRNVLSLSGSALCFVLAMPAHAATKSVSAAAVNAVAGHPILTASSPRRASVVRAQILLDRAHFSPGEIDGHFGGTMRGAVAAFNRARNIKDGARVSAATWKALNADSAPAIVSYTLTAADVAGPFRRIPEEMADKAKLPALGYESVTEMLGEKFHVNPNLLAALNPKQKFNRAGAVIQVPGVIGNAPVKSAGMSVRVSRSAGAVEALDAKGKVVARYPATTGSEHDPLPLGAWKINGVARNPTYNYNPDLFWDAEADEKKVKLAAGPNSPVGAVWIDLSKPHYGIHGTPVPSTIGKTSSHGCIRLTNWDVAELATLVTPGMAAVLVE